MSVWAFVSGRLAHAWSDDGHDYMVTACGNRAERRSTIDRSEKVFLGNLCQRCRARSDAPRRADADAEIRLAWPDGTQFGGGR